MPVQSSRQWSWAVSSTTSLGRWFSWAVPPLWVSWVSSMWIWTTHYLYIFIHFRLMCFLEPQSTEAAEWRWKVGVVVKGEHDPPSFATMEKRTGPAWCRAIWSGPFGDVRTKTWPYPCLWEMGCHSAWKDFSRRGSKEDEQVVGKTWALLPGCFPSSWGLLVVGPSTGRPLEGFLLSRGGRALGMVYGWEQSLEDKDRSRMLCKSLSSNKYKSFSVLCFLLLFSKSQQILTTC